MNPGWQEVWDEHIAKYPDPPLKGESWEYCYRNLALAVNSMPNTCDEGCNSHFHSEACEEKQAAWPAEEIVRLTNRVRELENALRDAMGYAKEVERCLFSQDGDAKTCAQHIQELVGAALGPTQRSAP